MLPVFIGKIDLQAQVFDDPPVDCRTEIRVFDGVGLDAQADFVPAVDRIADGVSDLMGYLKSTYQDLRSVVWIDRLVCWN